MILQVSVGSVINITFDDEMVEERPTPEHVEDYLVRIRQQAIAAWLSLPDAEQVAAVADED